MKLCGDECYDICEEYPPSCGRVKGHKGDHLYKLKVKGLASITIRLTWKRAKVKFPLKIEPLPKVSMSYLGTVHVAPEIIDLVRQAATANMAQRQLVQP
jgi:hypothetical protein